MLQRPCSFCNMLGGHSDGCEFGDFMKKARRPQLTTKEREMAARCIAFVLAGEWPYEGESGEAERKAAESAQAKLVIGLKS